MISDPTGRYIILLLELHSVLWAFVNICLPPLVDPTLLFSISEKLASLPPTHIIFAGDFNSILDPALDSSNPQCTVSPDLTQWADTFALTEMALETF